MLKRLGRTQPSSWICSRCLAHSQRHQRRPNSTFAAAATKAREPASPSTLYGLSPSSRADDDALRRVFDNASFWHSFQRTSATKPPSGIIGNKYLTHPEGFIDFVTVTIHRCNAVV